MASRTTDREGDPRAALTAACSTSRASVASTHHEKFDGSGYPPGLAGAEIPLEGRIAAVADVCEALICDRVHRPAWSVETTVAWMKGERGKHFGPQVFDGFLLSMEEILAVRVDLAVV